MIKKLFYGMLLAVAVCRTTEAIPNEQGYFLSWEQKKELMCLGRIQDSRGTWYDVWICPGYVPPATYARKSFSRACGNFGEYFEANKYHSLKEGSSACFDWALHECGMGFAIKGIPRAWGSSFDKANERTERRVFGWWMAYPWAFFESTVETAFRGALGAVGTVGGVATGLAVVPAYHALDSAVAGVWNLGVNTIIIPTVGITWNTVISPPLALIGQKPAVSRVDGFWVTVVNAGRPPEQRQLTPEEVRVFSEWGLFLLKETQPYASRREQVDKTTGVKCTEWQEEIKAAQMQAHRVKESLTGEERAHIRDLIATNGMAATFVNPAFTPAYGSGCETEIRRYLMLQNIPNPQIDQILMLLRTYQSSAIMTPESVRKKTDPLQRSAEIIEKSAEDTFR
ncbi:MAG: hypothetical protein WCS52_09535 [bacterium]